MQTETTFEKHVKLGISALNYDAHNIEAASIEGLLIPRTIEMTLYPSNSYFSKSNHQERA